MQSTPKQTAFALPDHDDRAPLVRHQFPVTASNRDLERDAYRPTFSNTQMLPERSSKLNTK
jgi:hypothetical protein